MIEDLTRMKRKVENAKEESMLATGAINSLNSTLKKDHEIESLEDAETLLSNGEKASEILREQIENQYQVLEKKFKWD